MWVNIGKHLSPRDREDLQVEVVARSASLSPDALETDTHWLDPGLEEKSIRQRN